MVLAAGDRILIYTSKNLKQWTYASEFGQDQGSHGGVWECPDLFELPVDGNPNRKNGSCRSVSETERSREDQACNIL